MSKLGNFWKTMLAGGAGVAALAAVNAAIRRGAQEPDDTALGGEAHYFSWKLGQVFPVSCGAKTSTLCPPISRYMRSTCSALVCRTSLPLLPTQPIFTSS